MKKFYRNSKELEKLKDFYYVIGEPYTYERSGQSIYVRQGSTTHYTFNVNAGDELPLKQLSFIRKVKSHIIKKKLYDSLPPLYKKIEDVKYLKYNPDIAAGEEFDHCYSVDIKAAYWHTAYKLGYLTTHLYEEGLTKDKRIRLASLGTFAKKRLVWKFDGKEEKYVGETRPKYPHIFFNCAHKIYQLMEEASRASGTDYLFFWTDGIYVKNKEAAAKVNSILQENGYVGKTESIRKITRTTEKFITHEKGNQKSYPLNIR